MSHSPSPMRGRETASLPATIPTNNDSGISHSLHRMSIGAAAATATATATATLPNSYQSPTPSRALDRSESSSLSPNGRPPARSPLSRSPSSMSIHQARSPSSMSQRSSRSPSSMSQYSRSNTPTLHKKASMNSLHGNGALITPARPSPRRVSSANMTNASTMVGRSPLSSEDSIPPPPRHTDRSIASKQFTKELELHDKVDGSKSADTIVILHDSCYGHRYSRPRTSKASLSTIVERPERLHASILGISVAYVCLGERHAEGQFPLHPDNDVSALPSVPFCIRKTARKLALSSQTVTNVHGSKWMEELKIMCNGAESKLAMSGKELSRPEMHRSPGEEAPAKFHEGDLYLCSESLDSMEGALGAVCEGVDAVFHGSASGQGPHRTFVAIRPPGHHCSASYPSGFCWLNNVHVGISHAALTHGLTHAAIIDFDLHHGDGSQAIAWGHNSRAQSAPKNSMPWKKTSIGYFSLHDINSYPCEMGDEEKVKNASLCIENAHGQSIWNIHLQPWKSEHEFWTLYEDKYAVLLEKTRNYLRAQTERVRLLPNAQKAKGAIFLSAGFDASEWESSGMQRHKVNVPTEFYARLTRDVVRLAAEEGTGVDGRVISVLEGGYSDRALCTGVLSHLSGMSAGDPVVIKKELSPNGLGFEMSQKVGSFEGVLARETVSEGVQSYDPLWWSLPRLEQLDAIVHGVLIPEQIKVKDGPAPTFSSPTQSFIAKVTSADARRNVSKMGMRSSTGSPKAISRARSPPPPEVDWTVAAHELSKLLIPTDRQTMSCSPEDLQAEATRARRDRQSVINPTSGLPEAIEPPAARMALRARKPPTKLADTAEEDEPKKSTRTNRRKTVAGAVAAADKAFARSSTPIPHPRQPNYTQPTTQSTRRLSTASNSSTTSEAPYLNAHGRVSSGGPMISLQRPGTSQSVRPNSAMSTRTVVARKPRAPKVPAPPRSEVAPGRVRRKSPLSDQPARPTPAMRTSPSRASSAAQPTPDTSAQGSDMDTLISSMNQVKITPKISLVTKAQREAREKQALQSGASKPAVRAPKTRPATKPAAEKPTLDCPQPGPAPITETEHALPSRPASSQALPTQPVTNHVHAADLPLPPSSPAGPISHGFIPTQHSRSALDSDSTPGVFIPYQPEGPPPTTIQSDSIRWLHPNTNTPAPKKADLPVFTSTSAIPFGTNPGNFLTNGGAISVPVNDENMRKEDTAMSEIPETPDR